MKWQGSNNGKGKSQLYSVTLPLFCVLGQFEIKAVGLYFCMFIVLECRFFLSTFNDVFLLRTVVWLVQCFSLPQQFWHLLFHLFYKSMASSPHVSNFYFVLTQWRVLSLFQRMMWTWRPWWMIWTLHWRACTPLAVVSRQSLPHYCTTDRPLPHTNTLTISSSSTTIIIIITHNTTSNGRVTTHTR